MAAAAAVALAPFSSDIHRVTSAWLSTIFRYNKIRLRLVEFNFHNNNNNNNELSFNHQQPFQTIVIFFFFDLFYQPDFPTSTTTTISAGVRIFLILSAPPPPNQVPNNELYSMLCYANAAADQLNLHEAIRDGETNNDKSRRHRRLYYETLVGQNKSPPTLFCGLAVCLCLMWSSPRRDNVTRNPLTSISYSSRLLQFNGKLFGVPN